MDQQRNLARAHPTLREFCSDEAFTGVAHGAAGPAAWSKHGLDIRTFCSSSGPFSNWTSYKMKQSRRNGPHAHRTGRHRFPDSSWAFSDIRGHGTQRQFSEDSGFSSCGSSASSIADDSEVAGGPVLSAFKASLWPSNEKKVSSIKSLPYSGTVASVLAAGFSSDVEESDEEGTNSIPCQTERRRSLKGNILRKFESSSTKVPPSLYPDLQLMHSGRNILDLGTNLQTQFPLQASKLPERNVPLYLLNRSQYHRLGKFGTSETLLYAKCENVCGFVHPVPPNEETR